MRIHYPNHSQLYLGAGRVLYCGPLQHLETHVYGCAVLHVGVYQPFRIKLGETWWTCRCVVIPPGVRHALDMQGGVHGKLFVETDSRSFADFKRRFPFQGAKATFFQDTETLEYFRWAFESNPPRDELERYVDRWLGIATLAPPNVDPRILRIVELTGEQAELNLSQEKLAAAIGLSPSRFQHLFREQMGIPYRRFRLWRRVVSAVKVFHSRDNMTYAAMEAGFADAAHFSHCFRDTFGVNPAAVFRSIERFESLP
jgi:AraC-like DNA-binding protein